MIKRKELVEIIGNLIEADVDHVGLDDICNFWILNSYIHMEFPVEGTDKVRVVDVEVKYRKGLHESWDKYTEEGE